MHSVLRTLLILSCKPEISSRPLPELNCKPVLNALQDLVFKVDGEIEPRPFRYDGTVTLQYANQNIDFKGRIADESVGLNEKYTASCKLTHPASFLDFDFDSEFLNSRENVGGNVQVMYEAQQLNLMLFSIGIPLCLVTFP